MKLYKKKIGSILPCGIIGFTLDTYFEYHFKILPCQGSLRALLCPNLPLFRLLTKRNKGKTGKQEKKKKKEKKRAQIVLLIRKITRIFKLICFEPS